MKIPLPNGDTYDVKTNTWEKKVTQNVDMKQAVAGATVFFRCGGSAVVEENDIRDEAVYPYRLKFVSCDKYEIFTQDGEQFDYCTSIIDIIRIEPPQFKWEDVKRGMAFKPRHCDYHGYYIGTDMEGFIVLDLTHVKPDNYYNGWLMESLTRAPEHDKVQS